MTKPDDYKHIEEWGRMMGSFHDYIWGQRQQAAQDGAPVDVVYRDSYGKWVRFADVTNQQTLDYFARHGFIK
jgi:hypothetical protein